MGPRSTVGQSGLLCIARLRRERDVKNLASRSVKRASMPTSALNKQENMVKNNLTTAEAGWRVSRPDRIPNDRPVTNENIIRLTSFQTV